MRFERTEDPVLIREVMVEAHVWRGITDDPTERQRASFQPCISPSLWYVLVLDGEDLLGLFVFAEQNSACYEVHTALLPKAWGPRGRQAAREMACWMFEHSGARRIVTTVPECNRLALKFARSAGMQEYGRNPKSFMKHGRLQDQILLGLSKEEV